MPFRKWAVEPVFLYKKPLPPDKNTSEFYSVTNVQLVNCLRQLSSVAKIADKIFEEIGSECRMVAERAHRLKSKISVVQEVVEHLNARSVKVPVSDLGQTARKLRTQHPYQTKYDNTSQLFLPSTRTPCVDELYGSAATTPVAVICTIDKYRTDGLSGSELFMVTPVLGGEKKRKQKRYLDIETRKPANFTLDKAKQDVVKCGSSSLPPVLPPSRGYILKQNENLELERLPSPEEQAMLVSLEYPSTVVPVDTSGTSFTRMSLLRRSLMHADFIIKRKKSKKRSKRRHTFCEGQNREIEQAIRNVTNTSCQTDDMLDTTISSSSASIHRSLSKRRSRSAMDNSRRKTILDELDLDSLQQDSKDSATEDDKEKSPSKTSTHTKKSKTSTLRSRSFNPISSISAAISIAAVKMRNSARGVGNKQDDGRSSSGNWSASSSTRASVDSDHTHTVSPVDGISSPSRNSVGKDSVLSDATQFDPHNRSRDEILLIQSLTSSPIKRKKFGPLNLPWEPNKNGRTSKTPTPDFTSQCSSSTPVIRSPYAGRRGVSDDGDSSVYSVDTDGYYTSMHTDSGLWCSAVANINEEPEIAGYRERKESQSSVSTIGNSSINSFLSKSATECSSNSGSVKGQIGPDPPPRVSSCINTVKDNIANSNKDQDNESSDKSDSPQPQNSSTSESDHEVRDRIRLKTAITANRYPSLCAVSPETSDEELQQPKAKIVPNVNIIVAEVHREEKAIDSRQNESHQSNMKSFVAITSPINKVSSINMYRSETPLPSHFSSSVSENNKPAATSTPRSGIAVSTFSPDLNDSRNSKDVNSGQKSKELDLAFDSDEDVTSPMLTQRNSEKSLIPLKYAQRITVTPISRSDSSSSCSNTGTIKRTPLKSYSPSNSLKMSNQEKSFTIPFKKKDSPPTYISFQSPDSPISSASSFGKMCSNEKVTASPTGSLPRPVARVTLDPSGKVVYSSNSLDRAGNLTSNYQIERKYSTLPSTQSHTQVRSVTPVKNLSSFQMDLPVSKQSSEKDNQNKNCSPSPLSQSHVDSRPTTPLKHLSTFEGGSRIPVQSQVKENQNYQNRNPRIASPSPSVPNSRSVTPRQQPSISEVDTKISAETNGKRNENVTCIPTSKSMSPMLTQSPLFGQSHNVTSAAKQDFTFRPSRGGRFCRSYFPSHLISPPSTSDVRENKLANKTTFFPAASNTSKCYDNATITQLGENSPQNTYSPTVPQSFTSNTRYTRPSQSNNKPPQQNYSSSNSQTPTSNIKYTRNLQSNEKLPQRNNFSNNSQTLTSNIRYTRPSQYSPNVPNTSSDNSTYLRSSAISNTNIWPSRLYNSQNKVVSHAQPPVTVHPSTNLEMSPKKITPQTSTVSLSPPDLIPSTESPPSTLDITSPASSHRKMNLTSLTSPNKDSGSESNSPDNQKNLKSMSATELFAIIHSSKKKHNIKSESELSMSPLSSRSVSPALSQSSLSKVQPVETGVLSKRGDFHPSDKTNWCNSMPSNFRKSTTLDKIPTKPTSMHDFKMLLLQARTGVHDTSPKPSAAELLKVSPTRNSPVPQSPSPKSPVPSSFKSPVSHYSSNPSYSPSHGTVPVKRNMRTRSPYLMRYDSAYPPILEDCSEEIENNDDNKCLNLNPYKLPSTVQRPTPVKATSTWV